MLEHNKKMQAFLRKNGINATAKYIQKGSLKGLWRLYNKKLTWTPELKQLLINLGFKDFDGNLLKDFYSNGSFFHVFVKAPSIIQLN